MPRGPGTTASDLPHHPQEGGGAGDERWGRGAARAWDVEGERTPWREGGRACARVGFKWQALVAERPWCGQGVALFRREVDGVTQSPRGMDGLWRRGPGTGAH